MISAEDLGKEKQRFEMALAPDTDMGRGGSLREFGQFSPMS